MIAQTTKTSCEDFWYSLLIICRGWVIPKCLSIGNTNIFGDMNILAKRMSSVLCCFPSVIWRSKSLKLIFVALGSYTLLVINLCLDKNARIKNYTFRGRGWIEKAIVSGAICKGVGRAFRWFDAPRESFLTMDDSLGAFFWIFKSI